MMSDIAQQLLQVQKRIADAANLAGRAEAEIQLLAVSKTKPLAAIQAAYQAGQRRFGESYVQEAVTKVQTLREAGFTDLEWHFIGPLQANKTRLVAEHFDWVHSVDRLKIAQRLSEQRPAGLPALNVCVQVNVSGEDSKSGVAPSEAPALARAQVGFAMGAAGSDTAIETADVALMDDDPRKLARFVRLACQAGRVLRQNLVLALGIKLAFLALTVAGLGSMWMAVFADVGASLLVIANGLRLLRA